MFGRTDVRGPLPRRSQPNSSQMQAPYAALLCNSLNDTGGPTRGASSASAIRRIAPRREEQGHVIMRLGIADAEADRDNVEERRVGEFGAPAAEIVPGMEDE